MDVFKKDDLIVSLKKLTNKNTVNLRCNNINCHVLHTLKKLHTTLLELNNIPESNVLFEINSVLDYLHEELNTGRLVVFLKKIKLKLFLGHWSAVPIEARQNFTIASYLKSLCLLHTRTSTDLLKQCLKAVDMGLLLGAPLEENPQLLCDAASILRQQLQNECIELPPFTTKRKIEDFQDSFNTLKGVGVGELEVPSVETFNRNFFIPQIPVKLKG